MCCIYNKSDWLTSTVIAAAHENSRDGDNNINNSNDTNSNYKT